MHVDDPVLRTEEALPSHDGAVVTLEGRYETLLVPVKKRGPPEDHGFAGVRVGTRLIRLGDGPRPDGERERFSGRMVRVRGRLVLRPPLEQPPHVAQPLPPPTLYGPEDPVVTGS